MKLTKDARMITADGKDVGNLNRFVINPKTKEVTHIVFEIGMLAKEEHVVPMKYVDHVDDQGIHLNPLPVKDVKFLPLFKEEQYIITDEEALLDRGYVSDEMVSSYYYYPPAPFGGTGILRPDDMYVYNPPESATSAEQLGVPVSGEPPVIKQEEQNIPDGTVAIDEGAHVYSSDGAHIGDVEKLVVDSRRSLVTHLIITKGLLFKERKAIPIDWIENAGGDEVYLVIDKEFAQRLPDYQEQDGEEG